mmetsp:Transcript_22688/g.56358  ORF Transcript_22688/g.56358 Transcript_22688/m.56358 type:complete len:123 (-) Transcript_22688:155-523(-)
MGGNTWGILQFWIYFCYFFVCLSRFALYRYHSDNEKEMGPARDDIVIASLSLGAERKFKMRREYEGELVYREWTLNHGSLFVMRGRTQQFWKHSLPKTKKCSEERLNLSFRFVVPAGDNLGK